MTALRALALTLLTAAWPAVAAAQTPPADDPSAHEHPPATPPLPPHVPPVTDADRAAVYQDEAGHTVHDDAIHYFVLVEQLEWQGAGGASDINWENSGWIGSDRHRFWFRTDGEGEDGGLDSARIHALYGRAIAPWWDVVVGVRQDLRPGSPQTWAAVGLQGLAPYWFEIEATAYIGASGRTHLRLETEYELLLTNRAILQPVLEADIRGKSDPERRTGAGLSAAELGMRLRYEIRRELAPYIGVTWHRKFFGTADRAREAGERTGGARLALGLRLWL